jgi:hypothetical protein
MRAFGQARDFAKYIHLRAATLLKQKYGHATLTEFASDGVERS